jgi:hypothetical protein
MTNEDQGIERKRPRATMSGDPDRNLELTLKKNPGDKQAQIDVGSDGSMDASDPPSACQPGGNDPAPSNDFPEDLAQVSQGAVMDDQPEQGALFQIEGPDEDGSVWLCSTKGRGDWCQNLGPNEKVVDAMIQWLRSVGQHRNTQFWSPLWNQGGGQTPSGGPSQSTSTDGQTNEPR